MNPRLYDYLNHIRQAAAESASFIEGKDKNDFLQSIEMRVLEAA